MACFQDGPGFGSLWVRLFHLMPQSESDEEESIKWRKNLESDPGQGQQRPFMYNGIGR